VDDSTGEYLTEGEGGCMTIFDLLFQSVEQGLSVGLHGVLCVCSLCVLCAESFSGKKNSIFFCLFFRNTEVGVILMLRVERKVNGWDIDVACREKSEWVGY
jgi:hypothetical protein